MTETLLSALTAALRRDPGRPLVTFYDGASGERVELSVATFDNWVNKIANLLSSDLGLDPGDGLHVDLPSHWLSPAVVVGGWTAGLVLSGSDSAAVRIVGPAAIRGSGRTNAATTIACSLRALGGRFAEPLPAGWLDFAAEVPPQPDVLLVPAASRPDDAAMVAGSRTLSQRDVVRLGHDAADSLGLSAGGRLATDLNPADPHALAAALAAPVVVDASVVLVVNATRESRSQIAEQEQVTCTRWGDETASIG